jgi:hypothetical protein
LGVDAGAGAGAGAGGGFAADKRVCAPELTGPPPTPSTASMSAADTPSGAQQGE